MSKGFLFWVIMVVILLFGAGWRAGWTGAYGPWGFGLILYILLFLLGWQVFGFVIH